MGSLYDTDFAAWSAAQASATRDTGRRHVNGPIDWENVAEEIETLGRLERLELASRIGTVIEHLLKLQLSPAMEPERIWRETVVRTRREIARRLKESPSLKRDVPAMIADEMTDMRALVRKALAAYGETPVQPLDAVAYGEATVLGDRLPDRRSQRP